MQQMTMFPNGEDLPLFSGTAQRATLEQFDPQPQEGIQLHLGDCPICEGTGIVYLHPGPNGTKFCFCEAGEQARKEK